jgi:hypothetical protein
MELFHVSFNVSVSNVHIGPFLGYFKLGQTPKVPQFGTMVFVEFCDFNKFDFVEQ